MSNPRAAVTNLASKQARRAASRGRRALKLSVEGVKDGWHAVRRRVEHVRDAGVNAAKDAFRRVRRPLRAASRHRSQMREQQQFYRTEWSIEHELETLVTRGRRLVVGPWLSEVGFEALYWVPFLHWLKTAFHVDPERVVAVSRGGVGGLVRRRGRPVRRDLGPHRPGRVRPAQRRAGRHQAARVVAISTARSWSRWPGASARATST